MQRLLPYDKKMRIFVIDAKILKKNESVNKSKINILLLGKAPITRFRLNMMTNLIDLNIFFEILLPLVDALKIKLLQINY